MATTTVTTETSTVPTHGKLRYITRGLIPQQSPHLYHLPPLAEFGDVRSLPITNIKGSLDLGDQSPYKLDIHGFTARRHPSKLHSAPYNRASWSDDHLLKTIYIPEVEALVKHVTGCKTVVTEAALLRSCLHTEVDGLAISEGKKYGIKDPSDKSADEAYKASEIEDDPFPKLIGTDPGAGASPAPKVHLDYSPLGARQHIRKYHSTLAAAAAPVIEAENALISSGTSWSDLKSHYNSNLSSTTSPRRFALFSIWRPLKPVTRDPLALSSCASFPANDYIPINVTTPAGRNIPSELFSIPNSSSASAPTTTTTTNTSTPSKPTSDESKTFDTESYLAYGPDTAKGTKHEWFWIANQDPTEVLVIQLFDNEAEAKGRGAGGGVMHSSVDVPEYAGEEARESLEVRCAAFW